jgi:hypothetical protein
VPATSLAGAAVSYSVVVSDPDTLASELTVLCVPASGSTFPLRANGATKATTVTCNAHDPADNDATPMSFMVTVLGADDQISGLAAAVAGAGLPKAVRDSLNGQLAKADKELAKALGGPPVDAFRHYIEALGALDEFVHRVSDETTRSSHPKDPIGPALAADLINAALQSERLCAPADFAALDQLITLAGQVYLSPDLAAGKQDGLRYALADLLLKAETKYLEGEQALAGGGARAQSDANGKFKQAQEHLGQFIQKVQQNTAGPQRPNGPISQPASTAFVTGAQQASATIGALIH